MGTVIDTAERDMEIGTIEHPMTMKRWFSKPWVYAVEYLCAPGKGALEKTYTWYQWGLSQLNTRLRQLLCHKPADSPDQPR